MGIYLGNLVTPLEDIKDKEFLAPDGITRSQFAQIGWLIVDKVGITLSDYKKKVIDDIDPYFIANLDVPYEFEGMMYKPKWRELYAGIAVFLDKNPTSECKLKSADGINYKVVNSTSINPIIQAMAYYTNMRYTAKHDTEDIINSAEINTIELVDAIKLSYLKSIGIDK